MIPPPILITGCGRSGASMIAGMLNICGAFGGDVGGPNKYFENVQLYKTLIVPYLESLKADPNGQYPLPDVNQMNIPVNWATKVIGLMSQEGYRGGPWFVKGSQLCLIWPVWHYAFPNAKWLIVRRRTGDIITSCNKTDFMKAFKDSSNCQQVDAPNETEGWKWWVHQHERRFIEMITEGLNCNVVWPERMIGGDYQQMFDAVDWLGLHWRSEALAFVDPKLWKARRNAVQVGQNGKLKPLG